MKVIITAEAKVKLSKIVEMDENDYKKYLEIIDSSASNRDIEAQIAEIACNYHFGYGNDIEDMDDPEEVTFEPFNS